MPKKPLHQRDPKLYARLVDRIERTRAAFQDALDAAADEGMDIGVAIRPGKKRHLRLFTPVYARPEMVPE